MPKSVRPREQLKIGDPLPDFRLTDQPGQIVTGADLAGKVLAINFIYTRCPLPDICPRLSANFAALQQRFAPALGKDLMLLSVTVDPEYDSAEVLAQYAKRWGASYQGWRFLTGDVASLAAQLGEVYWSDEGSIGHNSMTIGDRARWQAGGEGGRSRLARGPTGAFDRPRNQYQTVIGNPFSGKNPML